MRHCISPIIICAVAASVLTATSTAQALTIGKLNVRGFATGAVTKSDQGNPLENIGKKANFENDTKLGLNFSANINQDFSVAAQLLSTSVDSFKPTADWVFGTWHPVNNFALKVGKQKTNFWLMSEQVDVGLTYPWVRPPRELYYLSEPLKSFAGVNASYSFLISGQELQLEASYGGSNYSFLRGDGITSRNFYGSMDNFTSVAATMNNDWLTVRGSFSTGKLNLKVGSYYLQNAANRLYMLVDTPMDTGDFRFMALGSKVEWQNIVALGEYAVRLIDGGSLHRADAAYGTLGYRLFGRKLMPHITYSWLGHLEFDKKVAYNMPQGSQKSLIAGLNYYFGDSVVAKIEYQRTKATGGKGLFENYVSPNGEVVANVLNASVDFVF